LKGDFEHKMVIVVRADLGMSPGKMSAQVAHAAVSCAQFSQSKDPRGFGAWYHEGQRKVVLRANNLAELRVLETKARSLRLPTALIEDNDGAAARHCDGFGDRPRTRVASGQGDWLAGAVVNARNHRLE
jgi:PTH2 family peptidyl-tRNA hydrolase